jgi:hypothetical protein
MARIKRPAFPIREFREIRGENLSEIALFFSLAYNPIFTMKGMKRAKKNLPLVFMRNFVFFAPSVVKHNLTQQGSEIPMTRKGKIARLPFAIREELNQRLLDGEPGNQLVVWLNALPRVQAILKDKFQGNPISEANLSQWKNGGFPAWEAGERMADNVSSIMDGTKALPAAAKGGLTDRMALILTANMATGMLRLQSMPEGVEKSKVMRELRIGLLALKSCEFVAKRLEIEQIRHPKPAKKKKERKLTPEENKARIRRILGLGPGYDGSKNPELTLPPAMRVNPVQVNISESKQI